MITLPSVSVLILLSRSMRNITAHGGPRPPKALIPTAVPTLR